jgi:glucose/arabinose dehydrogenase
MLRRATLLLLILHVLVLEPTSTRAAEPERWISDLRFPVNMSWAPDGTLFFAEKETGDVRMVVDAAVAAAPVAHVDVEVSFETGLLGIAAHPDWPDEPWVYLYYSDPVAGINRLIRVRVEDGRETGRERLLDGLPTAAAYHNGGDMLFGPDGMLYLTVGEAHEADRAQDPADLGGKVLRLTPEGGIPADNPFPGSRTFTLGHRNSFGICVDPETGDLWETENGPSGGDEVNRLVAAADYGWPVAMGPLEDERYTDPFAFFPETIVPTGCAVWRGSLYVAAYGDGLLRRFPLDPPDQTPSVAFEFGEPVFDLAVGPDGRLYASTGDAIWWFGSAPASRPPAGSPTSATDEDPPPGTTAGTPGWVFMTIGVVLAVTLAATLRLTGRRR